MDVAKKLSRMSNVCLLGAGMSDIGIDNGMDWYTKLFYETVLSRCRFHSVRDEMTKRKLESIGIKNVLNTACPTMWTLTEEAQRKIPVRKARAVLTSITDYAFSPEQEKKMLEILSKEYEHVIIWVQGSHDIDWYLSRTVNLDAYELVGPRIDQLNSILENPDIDYIGTRLHAGIRCLNRGHRSLIVAVDNRARQIGRDTGLPVIERKDFYNGKLGSWINNPKKCEIALPVAEIEKWKTQWR